MAITPMMEQYLQIRDKYKDSIILFRLGDFYEMFFDQAEICSRELELTLTGKDCGLEERAPMCGIPFHSVNTYIPKLIEKGYKVALCEQVEDPREAKGIVKRDVVQVITPGTITETTMLDEKKNNYIASIVMIKKQFGLAYADVSTGEFYITSVGGLENEIKIIDEITKINPSELILPEEMLLTSSLINSIKNRLNTYISVFNDYDVSDLEGKYLKNVLNHCRNDIEKDVSILLLNYILQMQKSDAGYLNKIESYDLEKYMQLDANTRKNLEILESVRESGKKGSLLWVLDNTETAMGSRLLRKWLESPLLDKTEIEARNSAVEVFVNDYIIQNEAKESLKNIYDIERIISKVFNGNVNARDLVSLRNSLAKLPKIKDILKIASQGSSNNYLEVLCNDLDVVEDIYDLLQNSIIAEPPISVKEGSIIKTGYDELIDSYRLATTEGKNWVMQLEANEKEKTKIKNLKVGFNRVFGYYIEVTNSYKDLVDNERYIRRQTLAGAERYITQELKEIEEKILGSEEKLIDREYTVFAEVRQMVALQVLRIQKSANIVAILDTILSLAKVAIDNNYVKPKIILSGEINILNGRHPVVEKALKNETFVPNDVYLNNKSDRFIIITGPNMAGKSTYMRQTALITFMAQIGSFIPAESAEISIVDRIFTRVGASDDLASGQSTFMVEMAELAHIIKNATPNSLIILDEIGRGTSTYDGLSIAWATVEYISNKENIGAKTLFATHYHELTELEGKIDGVKNYCVEVKEKGDDVIFLRKIIRGGADESYGIYVAKIAGIPKRVIERAKETLKELENIDIAKKRINQTKKVTTEEIQMDLFNYKAAEIFKMLDKINLDDLSPKEALDVLFKLKDKMN